MDAELRVVTERLSARFADLDIDLVQVTVEREANRLRDAPVQSFCPCSLNAPLGASSTLRETITLARPRSQARTAGPPRPRRRAQGTDSAGTAGVAPAVGPRVMRQAARNGSTTTTDAHLNGDSGDRASPAAFQRAVLA
jgi:hypothetical protein